MRDHLVNLDLMDPKDLWVRRERMEALDFLGPQDHLVTEDLLGTFPRSLDLLEIKDPRVLQETRVFPVKMVQREKGELLANKALLVFLASLGWMV